MSSLWFHQMSTHTIKLKQKTKSSKVNDKQQQEKIGYNDETDV